MPHQFKSLLDAFQHKPLLLGAFAWGWFEIQFLPKPMAVFLLGSMMIVDLATGIVKSWKKGEATSPEGFQRTVVKVTRYCSLVCVCVAMANVININSPKSFDYSFVVNGCLGFLTFVEIYSICENVYEIDPDGILSKWLIKPFLKALKGKLKNSNPLKPFTDDEDTSNN